GQLAFGTVDSWLLWKLTGGRVHATDASNASRTLCLNLRTGDWDDDLLSLLGVPRAVLPAVVPSSGVVGETVDLGWLPRGIPVAGIAGDQQAALFGQACYAPGTAKNTYGTGCFLLLNTGRAPVVGLGAPWWDMYARGVIVGLTRGTTGAHLVRAALEAIAFQSRDVLVAMAADAGVAVRELRVDGGAAANDFLCQFQADLMDVAVLRPSVIEPTALGAAHQGG